MGLQQYKRTQWNDDALLVVGAMRLYFGKIFARWVYNNTNARNDMTMRCSMRLYLGKIFARWAYNQGTESPIFDASFWSENGVSCSHERHKIGDSVLCLQQYKRTQWQDDALLVVGAMRLYRGKIFARWVYNNTNARNDMTMRCSMRLYLCKIFARWAYNNTNARNEMTMRCLLSERCVCIFVVYLQDGFTTIQTHAMTWRCVACCRFDAFVFW